jgi:lipopolysaccharide transport system ATP-binding protein
MKPILEVQGISKKFKIHHEHQPYLSLRDSISGLFRKKKNVDEEFWALKDISFNVFPGESIGIIGRNGAGKSTLLKILSKITPPSAGKIISRGRIASLLEVGTGFHAELTGRENVYLNGSILGLKRNEINKHFDAIVDFSGVEKFLDTPLKHYSSGMQLRLAFAVAAHLEPEILIIDEVLAVGDAEFQKKCIGKMDEVSRSGRTILFVSHNLSAVQNLCNKSILLIDGEIEESGDTQQVIGKYFSLGKKTNSDLSKIANRKGNAAIQFTNGFVSRDNSPIDSNVEAFSSIKFELHYKVNIKTNIINSRIDIGINNYVGERVAWLSSDVQNFRPDFSKNKIVFTVINLPLTPGEYNCNLYCEINNEVADWLNDVLPFTVIEKDYYGTGKLTIEHQGNILLNYSIE